MVTNEIALSHDCSRQHTSVNRRKVLPSELTNTIEQFNACVHRNEAHFTYNFIYKPVYHTNVFDADNIYKNPPQNNVISPICFAIFISLFGSTHDSADCWRAHDAPRPPSCPRQLQTCGRLMHGWVEAAGCPPPPPTKILATPVKGIRDLHVVVDLS